MSNIVDGHMLKRAVISAANNLSNNQQAVNDLNVFPVPDGDTGTNMGMTISAAARELLNTDDKSISAVADAVASASLRGARGNSGVILSQLFRGLSKGLKGKESVDIPELAQAFKSAADTAYKAVMKPTEGTILTVARESAEHAVAITENFDDMIAFGKSVINAAKVSLDKTPDLLPVLKQAGVVDAGGQGLVLILEGALAALEGNDVQALQPQQAAAPVQSSAAASSDIDTANIKFMYCTEFIINKKSLNYSVTAFRASIEQKGDSMLVIEDDDIVKVHIHTNHPGFVLEQAVKIGDLTNIKIDNMKVQHNEIFQEASKPQSEPNKPYGFVAVAAGEGIEQIFTDIGADSIVSGGQSMNPSTDDILHAVNGINADTIYVLPNNKNIILAAQQAADLTDKTVVVLPTKSIPQGISALLAFDPDADVQVNTDAMTEAIGTVKTAMVTFAARDSSFDGMEIKEGDIMGMNEGKIAVLGDNPEDVAQKLIAQVADDDSAVISVFYGEETDEDKIPALSEALTEAYPNCDIMVHKGGQPLYYYIISVE